MQGEKEVKYLEKLLLKEFAKFQKRRPFPGYLICCCEETGIPLLPLLKLMTTHNQIDGYKGFFAMWDIASTKLHRKLDIYLFPRHGESPVETPIKRKGFFNDQVIIASKYWLVWFSCQINHANHN